MKKVLFIAFTFLGIFHIAAQEKINVKSGTSLELTYDDFQTSVVEIKNQSSQSFNIKVEDSSSQEWIKGFGLGPKGKEIVDVQPGQVLIFENNSNKDIQVALNFIQRKAPIKLVNANKMITFTLHNSSAKSIPLVIPNVMNPNLSPFSDSGVKLKIGQKIYYKKRGKKQLLLVVDDTIKDGDKIDVAKRIAQLEKEN